MLKKDELTNPSSCLNKADDQEMVFVLRARDPDAPGTIRDWIERRIMRGAAKRDDPKMQDAEKCARTMEEQQKQAK